MDRFFLFLSLCLITATTFAERWINQAERSDRIYVQAPLQHNSSNVTSDTHASNGNTTAVLQALGLDPLGTAYLQCPIKHTLLVKPQTASEDRGIR